MRTHLFQMARVVLLALFASSLIPYLTPIVLSKANGIDRNAPNNIQEPYLGESAFVPDTEQAAQHISNIVRVSQIAGSTTTITVNGRYAYIGLGTQLGILDATPNYMKLLGETATLPDAIREIAVAGNYAYVATGSGGLHVIDVSNPYAPNEVGALTQALDTRGVFLRGQYAYLADGSYGLRVVDVSDPAHPTQVGICDTPGEAINVVITDTVAYVADNSAGIQVINVSNPASPVSIRTYSMALPVIAVAVSNNRAYVISTSSPPESGSGLYVLDIGTTSNPQPLGSLSLPYPYDLAVSGAYVYVADENRTLEVVDVSLPASPKLIWQGDLYTMDAYAIALTNGFAYLVNRDTVFTYDVTRPAYPAYVYDYYPISHPNNYAGLAVKGNTLYGFAPNFAIIDVTSPRNPKITGNDLAYGTDLVVQSNYAYIANYNGMVIVNVSNAAEPAITGVYTATGWPSTIAVSGTYAYLPRSSPNGFTIINVSNPARPTYVTSYTLSSSPQAISISGKYVLVASSSDGLQVIDVSNPTTPIRVGQVALANVSAIAITEQRIYVANGTSVLVYNAANVPTLTQIGTIAVASWITQFGAKGNYIYFLTYGNVLRVIDTTNLSDPLTLAEYPTTAMGEIALSGNYVYLAETGYGRNCIDVLWFAPPTITTVPVGGGNLSTPQGVTLNFDTGSFASDTYVASSAHYPGDLPATGGLVRVSSVIDLSGELYGSPAQPLKAYTLRFSYTSLGKGAANENTLSWYSWDGSQWVQESSIVDTINKTVTATPSHFSSWVVMGSPVRRLYLPLITRFTSTASSVASDLSISGIEVTQAIQNIGNNVPLVQDRPTIVRIYGKTNGTIPVAIALTLYGYRNGVALPGSPLSVGSWAVFPSPSRESIYQSWNVALPSSWLNGSLTLTAVVDPNSLVVDPNRANNTYSSAIIFNVVLPLNVKILPVNYTDTSTGKYYPGPAADNISDWLRRAYPVSQVNISFRTSINFSGNLSQNSEWSRLLNAVTSVKQADGAPSSQVYYAAVSKSNNAGDTFAPYWGGISWIGQRISTGIDWPTSAYGADASGNTAAHEIGHALGRQHAPCGNPSGIDQSYPYTNGSIGQVGYDVYRNRIWTPNAPDQARDVMSYCSPNWVSDYTYVGLYNDQRAHGLMDMQSSTADGLMLRITFPPGGAPQIQPIYHLPLMLSSVEKNGEYTIELLGTAGQVVASYPVNAFETDEGNTSTKAIYANLPLPAEPITQVSLIQGGRQVAKHAAGSMTGQVATLNPSIHVTASQAVLQTGTGSPTLIRYSADGGSSWTVLAIDVTGGFYTIDLNTLPQNNGGLLEVISADTLSPNKYVTLTR